ncbi:MAG: PAS domain S-box protein [Ignavibacteria bacterium]|jgi:PAS domain S-box-containing protein
MTNILDEKYSGYELIKLNEKLKKELEKIKKEIASKNNLSFEDLPIPYFSLNSKGTLKKVNSEFLAVLGYKKSEVINKSFDEFINKKWEKRFEKSFAKSKARTCPKDIELKLVKKNNETIFVIANGSIEYYKNGKVKRTHCTFQNVTERIKTNEEIKLRAKILDSANLAVIATNTKGKIIYWGKMAEKIYGWRRNEVLGEKITEVAPSKLTKGKVELVLKKLGKGKIWEGDFLVQKKDGSEFLAHVIDSPITDENGKLIGIIGISRDITLERENEKLLKESNRKLVESEQKYKTVVDSSPSAILITKKEKYVFANHAAANMLGFRKPEEVIGRSNLTSVGPEAIDLVNKRAKNIKEGKFNEAVELKMVRQDGSVIFVDSTSVPINYDGEEAGLIIGVDITKQKEIEKEVRENEKKLNLAFEGAGIAYWDQDYITGKVYRSKEWAAMLGYRCEDINDTLEFWKTITHPDEIEYVEKIQEQHEKGRTPHFKIEQRLKNARGEYQWVLNWGKIYKRDVNGKPIRALGFHIDITDRKKAEEELKIKDHAISSTINAIAFTDLNKKVSFVNKSLLQMWGYEDENEVIGRNVLEFWKNPEEVQSVISSLEKKGSLTGEFIAKKKNGSFFCTRFWANLIYNSDNKPIAIMSSLVDISEQKNAEKELNKKIDELERFNRAMVGREMRMIELKEEVNNLCEKLSLPKKYRIPKEEDSA